MPRCRLAGACPRQPRAVRAGPHGDLRKAGDDWRIFGHDHESQGRDSVPRTEGYDYAGKFDSYRFLPSFEEYILIAQDRPRVHVFRRMPDDRWLLTPYDGLDRSASVESLRIALPISEICAGIEFHSAKA